MKKVFLMAALVLACTSGSMANEWNEVSLSETTSCPVKKTTKKSTKKTTTKKTTTKKTTTAKATTSTSETSSTDTSTTPSTASTAASSKGSAIAGILGGLLGGSSSSSSSSSTAGGIINGILNNVIGSGTFKQADLCASTWKYNKPGCAFTSENLLAKAGGEIAANKIEKQLQTYYKKASSLTQMVVLSQKLTVSLGKVLILSMRRRMLLR